MDDHIATTHNGTISDVILSKIPAQEDALKKAIEECRSSSVPQDPVGDEKAPWHQILSEIGDSRISNVRANRAFTAMTTANEPILTQEIQKSRNCGSPVITSDNDIETVAHATVGTPLPWHTKPKQGSSQVKWLQQPHPTMTLKTNTMECVSSHCTSMPYVKRIGDANNVGTSRPNMEIVADSTKNSGKNVIGHEIEPVEQNSPAPKGPKPCARLISISSMEAPSDNKHNTVTSPVIAYNRKRIATVNPYNDPAKTNLKRASMVELMENFSRLDDSNDTTPERKRNNANDGSREINNKSQRSKSVVTKERFDRPTTSAQATLNVSKSKKDTKEPKVENLTIFISDGTASFRTSDGRTHNKAPLSSHFAILKKSKPADNGCKTNIIFIRKWTAKQRPANEVTNKEKTKKIYDSLAQFKAFKDQLYLIAFLWADSNVEATFSRYPSHKKAVSLSVFCDSLFNETRSILVCKELDITLNENWPLSIVTNVADRIQKCTLNLREITSVNGSLHKDFLDELYRIRQMKLPQEIQITLEIHHKVTSEEFVTELKERSRRSTGRYFKFELRSAHVNPFSISPPKCSLKAKRLGTGRLLIEQCPSTPTRPVSASSTRFL
ncbi:hypothetical protein DdX_14999 [Ditylenchus destructor]|uniref:Uncharacterized protein n=1 Tax=Ditylenchus destructor TaxID=166010 RepID=A0AAD4MW17_9BILA|nr:hypothetical protein DdX_14999 [Ditylenchus destructor]